MRDGINQDESLAPNNPHSCPSSVRDAVDQMLQYLILLLVLEACNNLVDLGLERVAVVPEGNNKVPRSLLTLEGGGLAPIRRKDELEGLCERLKRLAGFLANVCDPAVEHRHDTHAQLVVCEGDINVKFQVLQDLEPAFRLVRLEWILEDAHEDVHVLGLEIFKVTLADLVREGLGDEERVEVVEGRGDGHVGERVAEDLGRGGEKGACKDSADR
jgi:hypothetical protein